MCIEFNSMCIEFDRMCIEFAISLAIAGRRQVKVKHCIVGMHALSLTPVWCLPTLHPKTDSAHPIVSAGKSFITNIPSDVNDNSYASILDFRRSNAFIG